MSDICIVTMNGRLVRDPELRYSQAGTAVCRFSLANSQYQGAGKEDYVSFLDVVAFGRRAEVIAEHCKKGAPLLVTGTIKQERWKDQEGNAKSRISVILSGFQFMGGSKPGGSQPQAKEEDPYADIPGVQVNLPPEENPFSDDDIPF